MANTQFVNRIFDIVVVRLLRSRKVAEHSMALILFYVYY